MRETRVGSCISACPNKNTTQALPQQGRPPLRVRGRERREAAAEKGKAKADRDPPSQASIVTSLRDLVGAPPRGEIWCWQVYIPAQDPSTGRRGQEGRGTCSTVGACDTGGGESGATPQSHNHRRGAGCLGVSCAQTSQNVAICAAAQEGAHSILQIAGSGSRHRARILFCCTCMAVSSCNVVAV